VCYEAGNPFVSFVAGEDRSDPATGIVCRPLSEVTTAARAAYWAVKLFDLLAGL
jgi:hypothetical protein